MSNTDTSECPECGATAVEPCHKEPPKIDCVRDE